MPGTELVVTVALCFASEDSSSQLTVHILKTTPRGQDFGVPRSAKALRGGEWPKPVYINLF